ncbi:hypothetical protein [Rhodospirillum sp. A1_3_36]|uniref:hypothetical protein n=1 Tax=Rhodospirillum sp. A1_3_36 TaxID=3391666 RepID=UPI0039A70DCE
MESVREDMKSAIRAARDLALECDRLCLLVDEADEDEYGSDLDECAERARDIADVLQGIVTFEEDRETEAATSITEPSANARMVPIRSAGPC